VGSAAHEQSAERIVVSYLLAVHGVPY
jgi:hypothetical protein